MRLKDFRQTQVKLANLEISGELSMFFLPKTQPVLYRIDPFLIHHIKANFPEKTELTIQTETKCQGDHKKYLSVYDLWIKKADLEKFYKKMPSYSDIMPDSERATMLKLILGMAMDAYNYKPDRLRNEATGSNRGSIKTSLEELGLDIEEETVRKYLKEAKVLYPDVKAKAKNRALQD